MADDERELDEMLADREQALGRPLTAGEHRRVIDAWMSQDEERTTILRELQKVADREAAPSSRATSRVSHRDVRGWSSLPTWTLGLTLAWLVIILVVAAAWYFSG
jgi:type VI protein secretion system component VasF